MLRFILWSLLFYGIYRLIWPSQRTVSQSPRGQGNAGGNGGGGTSNKSAGSNGGGNNRGSQSNPTNPPASQPTNKAADQVGEYIEYEEVR